jgi:hypothetical protein
VIDELLRSPEPSIRWKVRTRVLGEPDDAPGIRRLRREIRRSPRVAALLSRRDADGRISDPSRVYQKWQGAHWVLAALADLGYPAGDAALEPLARQVCETWLGPSARRDRIVAGRHRRCGSIPGNALFAASRLGLAGDCASRLAALLTRWQWPEGGWNCDPRPEASSPSFMETLVPMRALVAYASTAGSPAARSAAASAAHRAAEVFLERRLFRRRTTGEVISKEFVTLHYPLYWHYDVLGGLVGLAEAGRLADPRCADALDLLESKRLPDGGWPAEARYYRQVGPTVGSSGSYVDWGGVDRHRANPWVTADALWVLTAAGRLAP